MFSRRYAEPLFDVLIAGGVLAPGGKTLSVTRAEVCVFSCEPMVEAVRGHVQVSSTEVHYRIKLVSESILLLCHCVDPTHTAVCFFFYHILCANNISMIHTSITT